MVKNPPANAADTLTSWGWEDPLQKEWQPTPVFCLENPMDRGAGWATVHGVSKGQTLLGD